MRVEMTSVINHRERHHRPPRELRQQHRDLRQSQTSLDSLRRRISENHLRPLDRDRLELARADNRPSKTSSPSRNRRRIPAR